MVCCRVRPGGRHILGCCQRCSCCQVCEADGSGSPTTPRACPHHQGIAEGGLYTFIPPFHPIWPQPVHCKQKRSCRSQLQRHHCHASAFFGNKKIVNGVGIWALLLVLLSVQLLHQRCRRCLHPTDIAVSEIDVVGEWLRPPS